MSIELVIETENKNKLIGECVHMNLVPAISTRDVIGGNLTDIEVDSFKKSSCHKLPREKMIQTIVSFIKNNDIPEKDKELFIMILQDNKILNKLQICTDGSYVNGRIFYKNFFNNWDSNIQVDGRFWSQYYSETRLLPDNLTRIGFMKDNFEVIYLHLVDDIEAMEDKEWHDEMDSLSDDDYYEDVSN
jgi:hypothetical protein